MAQSHAGEAILEQDKDQGHTPKSGSYSWSSTEVPTLSFHEGETQGLWSKERSQVCGPSSLGPLPLSASVSLCGPVGYYVGERSGRVYEILGLCSLKAVFPHKSIDPFLATW